MISSPRIDLPRLPPTPNLTGSLANTEGPSFQEMFLQALRQTAGLEGHAQELVTQSISGGEATMIEASVALREADLALKLMLQVRNKLLEAYNEIKQMQF